MAFCQPFQNTMRAIACTMRGAAVPETVAKPFRLAGNSELGMADVLVGPVKLIVLLIPLNCG